MSEEGGSFMSVYRIIFVLLCILTFVTACGRALTIEQEDATTDAAAAANIDGVASDTSAQVTSATDWFTPSSAEPPDQEWQQHNPSKISLVVEDGRTVLRLEQGSSLRRTLRRQV